MSIVFPHNKEKDRSTTEKDNKPIVKNIYQKPYSRHYDDYNGLNITYLDANYGNISDRNNDSDVLLDSPRIAEIFETIRRVCVPTKYVHPIDICISNSSLKDILSQKNDANASKEQTQIGINISTPKWDLEDIYLTSENKKNIESIICLIQNKDKLYKDWGFEKTFKKCRSLVLNFYGKPGTGKTISANAIAKASGKKLINVNYSELESKYVGDTPKNISKIFNCAKENDAIIIFDEADSFLGKRIENVQQSADYGVNVTRSVMLMELDNFDGVVVFTTNLFSNYDEAFKRRILMNVEFALPDVNGREYIWRKILPDKFPIENGISSSLLAQKYDNISGADIKDIAFNCAILTLKSNNGFATINDFDEAYRIVKSRYINSKTESPKIAKITTERVMTDNNIDQ